MKAVQNKIVKVGMSRSNLLAQAQSCKRTPQAVSFHPSMYHVTYLEKATYSYQLSGLILFSKSIM